MGNGSRRAQGLVTVEDTTVPATHGGRMMEWVDMDTTSRARPSRRTARSLAVAFMVVSLFAVACTDDEPEPAAIATNDGGVLVKPPDVLEGNPVPTSVAPADVGTPVDGLSATPLVEFVWFDGSPASTGDFAGRPTVINFWASNCAACIAEMPDFELASQALGGRVQFVGVNVADVRADALELAAQTGVTYPLADDPDSEVFRAFGGFVMPTTALLNPQGQVAFVWSGVLTNEELRILIDTHILPGSNDDA